MIYNIILLTSTIAWFACVQRFQAVRQVNLFASAAAVASCVFSLSYSDRLVTSSRLALAIATTICYRYSGSVALLHLVAAIGNIWESNFVTTGNIYGAILHLLTGWILLAPGSRKSVLTIGYKALLLDGVKQAISLWNKTCKKSNIDFDTPRKRYLHLKTQFYMDPTQKFSSLRSFVHLQWKKAAPLFVANFLLCLIQNYKHVLLIKIYSTFATGISNNAEFLRLTTLWILSHLTEPAKKYVELEYDTLINEYEHVLHNYFFEDYFAHKSDYDNDAYNIRSVEDYCNSVIRALSRGYNFLTNRFLECANIYLIISKMGMLAGLALAFTGFLTIGMSHCISLLEAFEKQFPIDDSRKLSAGSIIANMRTIKQYAWESKLAKMVHLNKCSVSPTLFKLMCGIADRIATHGPKLISTIIIIYYAKGKDSLTFLEVSTLMHYVSQLSNFTQSWKDVRLIADWLLELEKYVNNCGNPYKDIKYIAKQSIEASTANAIELDGCCFSWGPEKFSLQPMTLAIKPGSFVTVVGKVGSGKSSLLSALCGEMPLASGCGCVYGRLGYVSQKPWIMNATFKENVLFGNDYDNNFYNRVISACALDEDLKQLPAGDQTEIGHKGINLSGGQKARLALARAIYNNADVYMLDDILSAVDAQVERHLVEQVLSRNGILNGKTCILVTHAEHVVPLSDINITLDNGDISIGKSFACRNINITSSITRDVEIINPNENSLKATSFTFLPETQKSQSSIALIWKFIGLSGYGVVAGALAIQLTNAYMQYYLLNKKLNIIPRHDGPMTTDNVQMYLMLELLLTILCSELDQVTDVIKDALWIQNATTNMLLKLLNHLLGSQLFRFERLSHHVLNNIFANTARIISRGMSSNLISQTYNLFKAFATLCGIFKMSVFMVVATAILILLIKAIDQAFDKIFTEFEEEIEANGWLEVQNATSELLDGHEMIRVHDKVLHYSIYLGYLASDIGVTETQMTALRHVCSFISDLVQMSITLTVLLYLKYKSSTVPVTPGNVQELVTLSEVFYDALYTIVENNGRFAYSLDEFKKYLVYAENIDQEAPWVISKSSPANDWPSNGVIKFQDYSLRYRDELDVVLHSLSFNTKKYEKIGIVGRTGAGKSSLSSALLRLVEADSGSIFIDGVDISTLGLHDLRSRISMVPQDPMLLQGTIRMNLDPAQEHTDEDLWKAIDKAHIRDLLNTDESKGETGLNTLVEEGGINFSVGQRQLISLCRALLWKRKIVILDEATANIDTQTDQLMQSIIRKEFAECTVLTIAHRLKTVIDSDRIMVLDQGKIVEFDTPDSLLAADGQFSKLVQSMEFNESTLK